MSFSFPLLALILFYSSLWICSGGERAQRLSPPRDEAATATDFGGSDERSPRHFLDAVVRPDDDLTMSATSHRTNRDRRAKREKRKMRRLGSIGFLVSGTDLRTSCGVCVSIIVSMRLRSFHVRVALRGYVP